jgi:hypothetical protein
MLRLFVVLVALWVVLVLASFEAAGAERSASPGAGAREDVACSGRCSSVEEHAASESVHKQRARVLKIRARREQRRVLRNRTRAARRERRGRSGERHV